MMLIPQSLKLWGFENVHCVKEQMVKSGDFPTVVSPNPENGEALTLALRDAKELDADIVMASDPDADRVGMGLQERQGRMDTYQWQPDMPPLPILYHTQPSGERLDEAD